MGRIALTPEQKLANDTYRKSAVGLQEKVLKNKLKTIRASADALKASNPTESEKIDTVVRNYTNLKTLEFTANNSPEDYIDTVRKSLENRVVSLEKALTEARSKVGTVDVNAARQALENRLASTKNKLTEAITAAGNVNGKSVVEHLELDV